MFNVEIARRNRRLPEVTHVEPRTENADQLILVIVNIPLHDIHARAHQTFKRLHIQNWKRKKKKTRNK